MQGFRVRNSLVGKPKIPFRNTTECPARGIELTSLITSSSKIKNFQPTNFSATSGNIYSNSKATRSSSLLTNPRAVSLRNSSANTTPRSGTSYQYVKTDFLKNSAAFRRGIFVQNKLKPTSSVRLYSASSHYTHSSSATTDVVTPFPDHSYHTQKSVDKYRRFKDGTDVDKRNFTYFMASGFRFALISGARLAVLQFVYSISPSRSVLALASIEVDVSTIAEGKTVTLKWRGKPVFIRHRTPEEIQGEAAIDVATLRDPQKDSERYRDQSRPEIVVLLGVCTHLGCVPLTDAGEIPGGFFCPCHGSHYDTSGRIRRGPAPKNLEIPTYKFLSDSTVLIG